jgi:GNAT superfamily N-acetyltransferase
MTPTIHLAGPADLPQIVRLLRGQFEEHAIPAADEGLAKAAGGMLEDPARGDILLASVDGRAVGIAVLAYSWTLEHGGLSCWLDELYVEPALRSKGIGRAMLRSAMEHVKARGAAAIDLEVVEGHERAANLYVREGFRRRDRVRWVRPL